MRALPLSRVYQLIEPGPVVLLSTARKTRGGARPNVMTMSWHMMVEFEPPLIACLVSGANHSFAALDKTGECVIAIPARKMAKQVVAIGNSTGAEIDKFAAFGLTARPAKKVAAPSLPNASPIWNAGLPTGRWSGATTSSSSRWCRPGSTPRRSSRKPSTTRAMAASWSTGRCCSLIRACADGPGAAAGGPHRPEVIGGGETPGDAGPRRSPRL